MSDLKQIKLKCDSKNDFVSKSWISTDSKLVSYPGFSPKNLDKLQREAGSVPLSTWPGLEIKVKKVKKQLYIDADAKAAKYVTTSDIETNDADTPGRRQWAIQGTSFHSSKLLSLSEPEHPLFVTLTPSSSKAEPTTRRALTLEEGRLGSPTMANQARSPASNRNSPSALLGRRMPMPYQNPILPLKALTFKNQGPV